MGGADLPQGVDDAPELGRVADRRLPLAGDLPRGGGVWPVLAAEQAAGERAPDQDADAVGQCDRNELILGLARLQGIVNLLGDETREAAGVRNGEGLHQVPGREVRRPGLADLAPGD